MVVNKDKKSFKKFAKKHLATHIENRRKGSQVKKEKKERVEKRKEREIKNFRREEDEHREQLSHLKELDPTLYQYLEQEDPTILQFGIDEVDLVDNDLGEDSDTDVEDIDDEGKGVKSEKGNTNCITSKELHKLLNEKKLGELIDLFCCAAKEMGFELKERFRSENLRKFETNSLIEETLLKLPNFFSENLGLFFSKDGSFLKVSYRGFLGRFLSVCMLIIEAGHTDAGLTASILRAMIPFAPIFHRLRGFTKSILKTALNLCTNDSEIIRIPAYLLVRALATRAAGTRSLYQSAAFKGIFLALIRTARQYNARNMLIISFLINSIIDLYGTDIEVAYQHIFVYLRQLALYQRATLHELTPGNIRAIFNWQYLQALRAWGLVVSTYHLPEQLGPLIHPVVQLSLGMLELFSSPRMIPMQLHVIELLNQIEIRTGGSVYIPLTPYLLRILTFPSIELGQELTKRSARQGEGNDFGKNDLFFLLRVKKQHIRNLLYRTTIWETALYCLVAHMSTHAHMIGFPEIFWSVEVTLKKLAKNVKVVSINLMLREVNARLVETAKKILQKRSQVKFSPCDISAVQQFQEECRIASSPLVVYYNRLRKTHLEKLQETQQNLEDIKPLESIVRSEMGKKKALK